MERMYFALRYRLDKKDRYLISFTADVDNSDGVAVNADGTIPIFVSKTDLMSYAQTNGFTSTKFEESRLHNLDVIAKWLNMKKMKRSRRVDCMQFLSAWNLFADASKSVGSDFDLDRERTLKIYEKLFWGNNLMAVTPPGKFYVPIWSAREIEIIHEVMSHGLSMFRHHVKRP